MTRALARAGLVVSGAFLISRVLGWIRYLLIVNTLPTSDVDTFLAAFRLPDLIFQLVAAGALSSAMIPIIASLIESDEERRAWRVVATVANLMLGALLLLAAILFILAPWLVPIITPGFEQPQLDQEVELTRIMLLSPIFLALGSMATSVLNSRGKFAESAIAPIVYNLAIIGGTILLGPTLGVTGVAIAVVAGSIGHLLVQLPSTRRLGYRHHFHIDRHDPQARRAFALMAPRAVGLGAVQITFVVVTAVASTLGTGSVTAFNNAFLLLQIPLGVIGVPLGIVLLPTLSRDAAAGRPEEYAGRVARALRLLVFVDGPDRRPRHRAAQRDVGAAVRARPDHGRDRGRDRGGARGAAARAGRPLDDRRRRPGVLRPPGHEDAGRSRARRGLHRLRARRSSSAPSTGSRESAWRSRSAPGSRRRSCSSSCGPGCQELSLRGVVLTGVKAVAATLVACVVAIALNGGLGLIGSTDPGVVGAGGPDHDRRGPRARGLPAARARLAHPGTALYRRDHGRPAPPPAPSVSDRRPKPVDPDDATAWDAFVSGADPGSYLQLSPWAAVKAVNGWSTVRLAADGGGEAAADRRPGARPAPAAAAVGLRLRPARPGRGRLVAGHGRGPGRRLRRGLPHDAPGEGRPGLARPGRPRDRGRRTRRTPTARPARRSGPPASARHRRSSPMPRESSTWPPTRTRSGAISARSGAST